MSTLATDNSLPFGLRFATTTMANELDSPKKIDEAILRGILMAAIDNSKIIQIEPSLPEKTQIVREQNIFHKMCADLRRINLHKPTGKSNTKT